MCGESTKQVVMDIHIERAGGWGESIIGPGHFALCGENAVGCFFEGSVFVFYIVLEAGVGGFEDEQVFYTGGEDGLLPVSSYPGLVFFGASIDEGVGVRNSVDDHSFPAVFIQLNFGLRYLWVIGYKVICQVEAKFFDRSSEFVFGQRIDGIFHRIGGQDLCIVANGVNSIEIALQGYIYGDVPYLVMAGMPDNLRQADSLLPVCVGVKTKCHPSI